MLGAGLDGVGPTPFALTKIGGRKQIADRENAGQGVRTSWANAASAA